MNVDSDEDVWSRDVQSPPQLAQDVLSPSRNSITSVRTLANPFALTESETRVLPRYDSREGRLYDANRIGPHLEIWERILYVYEDTDILSKRCKRREQQIRELKDFEKWIEKENKILYEELQQCIFFSPKAFLTFFFSCLLLNYAFSPFDLSQQQNNEKK